MKKVKVQELAVLFALNVEILGSNEIKQSVDLPLKLAVNAQKNIKALREIMLKKAEEEEEIKKLACRKGEDNKPVLLENGKGGFDYDIPKETREQFYAELKTHREAEVEVELITFPEPVSEIIIRFIKNDKEISAADKSLMLLEYMTDLK